MNLDRRQRTLGLIAGGVLAIFIADRLVFTPLIQTWKSRSTQIKELQKRVQQGTALLERERIMRGRWDGMQTNALSSEASTAQSQLLKAFYRWSEESGVSVSSIRPQAKQANDDTQTIECRADAFGKLSSLSRFLYLIEKDTLGVKIDSIELTPRDKQAEEVNLILQVSGLMLPTPRS